MKFKKRTRTIERYLAGRMTPDEESLFLEKLNRDRELRQLVDEETAIDRALRLDRDAIPELAPAPPERLLQKLDMDPASLAGQSRAHDPRGRMERIISRFREGGATGWMLVVDLVVIGATAGFFALEPGTGPVKDAGKGHTHSEARIRSGVNTYLDIIQDHARHLGSSIVIADARGGDSLQKGTRNEARRGGGMNGSSRDHRPLAHSLDTNDSPLRDFPRRDVQERVRPTTMGRQLDTTHESIEPENQ